MNEETKAHSHGNIQPVIIQNEMRECYLDYAMSVIIGRALPDVRDGLKPVHRRVLFAMHVLNNYHAKPFVKAARVVGDVIGKYHPHGDSAVYNTIVRMAQDFSLRYPLVDGQGNFGSVDGDSAAAMRYTEVRMQKLTEELLHDIDKDTVDWGPNYDGSLKEPLVLPTRLPNLLVNGSTGIAVGMATNIPPHNLKEVMNALVAVLDNSATTIEEIMRHLPGPDFPTAGSIHGIEGIRSAYHTGKGVVQIRAKAEIEPMKKSSGREQIVITEIPYMVNKAKLVEKIADMANAKEIEGISDIRDESNRLGIRVVIDLRKGENANVILNKLYKHTQMQDSFGINFLSIHDGRPRVMNIKELLQCFIDHRREVVIRRTSFELKKAKERAHILAGLKIAVENIDRMIETIKKAEGPQEARTKIMSLFSLTDQQAQAILEMRLQRLTGLERDKIIKDHQDTVSEIKRLEEILASDGLVKQVIRNEFLDIMSHYSDDRRTLIIANADEIRIEDMVKPEEVLVSITHKGYIKRMTVDTYKAQNRGGKGVKGGIAVDEDFFIQLFTANTHDSIMFFTNRGTVFIKKVYEIPEANRTAKGRNIVNFIQVPPGERIVEIIPIPNDVEGKFLIVATKKGTVKRSELSEYNHIKNAGIRAIKVRDGDAVISVRVTDGSRDVLLCSSKGIIIRFSETDCRSMGRVSQGVKGMELADDANVIGMETIDDNMEILSVTENGLGKRTMASEYRKQTRGGKGILAMRLTERTGNIVVIKPVSDKEDLMIITDKGQVIRIRISGVSLLSRTTQGVKLISLHEGEKVAAVEKLAESDSDDQQTIENTEIVETPENIVSDEESGQDP